MKVIPCKTFLVGEYAVLVGGEAIGLATGPGFSISEMLVSYHTESAAALYLNSDTFNKIESNAPGGFGKSTAEFIFSYLSKNNSVNLKAILEIYLALFDKNPEQRPSGADLVIQCLGQVTHVRADRLLSTSGHWPFKKLGFSLVSTGLKIATHDHLKNLNREFLSDLPVLSARVVSAFLKSDQKAFFSEMKVWREALESKGLTHPDVISMMTKLDAEISDRLNSEFVIKQCGAFGADVMIIIFEKYQKEVITNIVNKHGLSIVATENELMDGVLY